MRIDIMHKPADLSYDRFSEVDRLCFPGEPLMSPEQFAGISAEEMWGAFVGGRLAGYARFVPKPEGGHLSRIGVHPDYRRMGVATALMQAVINQCRGEEAGKVIVPGRTCSHSRLFAPTPTVSLYVQTDNRPAIALYEKFGFRPTASAYQFIVPIREIIAGPWIARDRRGTRLAAGLAGHIQAVPVADSPCSPKSPLSDPREPRPVSLRFVDSSGAVLGGCRLDPGFPGCSPFTLEHPDAALVPALLALEEYLDPAHDFLVLTFPAPALAETCRSLGFKLNYELLRMEVTIEP